MSSIPSVKTNQLITKKKHSQICQAEPQRRAHYPGPDAAHDAACRRTEAALQPHAQKQHQQAQRRHGRGRAMQWCALLQCGP